MSKKSKGKKDNALVKNRKAFHDYHILESYEAGLELKGTEVKSCRASSISLADSYVKIENGEAFLFNVHIAVYDHGNRFNHDPKRVRRLLLHKNEILKLSQLIKEKGNTIVPLKFYMKRGKVKVEIGVAKGKSHSDKRDTLRKKQDDLEARRAMARH
jgi:SsrA-binding protein